MRRREDMHDGALLAGGPALNGPDEHDSVHVAVLAEEVLRLLGGGREEAIDGWIVDATLGAGGHSALLLERFPRLCLFGTDQDPEILSVARERFEPFQDRVHVEHCRMSELAERYRKARLERPVGFLMDLGASSLQLDRPERGFSFSSDGPLDMRMDPRRERTAADIVNEWDEDDLADLFFHEGGERGARRVAAAIVEARRRVPFRRTRGLAEIVARALGRPLGGGAEHGRIHPATRVFQALRRAVNEEGEELALGIEAAECLLADKGLLMAISFHSGEDRVVKHALAAGAREGRWELVTRRPITPTDTEVRNNPRARSAKLRAARRLRPTGGDTARP